MTISSAVEECFAVVCRMEQPIADTLAAVAALPLPVVRTSHLGNATANNYGWLALARNTYLGPIDHNLYGVDDIYFPWARLGDGGVIEALVNHRGEPVTEALGQHAATLRKSVRPHYCSFVSFGISGETDLIAEHLETAAHLSRRLNGSEPVPRSAEIYDLEPIVRPLIREFFKRRELHLLFNRWVESTPKGYVKMYRLDRFDYHGGDVAVYTAHTKPRFSGSIEELIDCFFATLARIRERLRIGRRREVDRQRNRDLLADLAYPWLTGPFNLLLNAVKEYRHHPEQRIFWHVAAATNHLYISQDGFRSEYFAVAEALERCGYLPEPCELRFIPSYSCQLFATRRDSLAVLEELVALWTEVLARQGAVARQHVAAVATSRPAEVAAAFDAELPRACKAQLRALVERFNALDANRLPIAYVADPVPVTYNKFGIAQRRLLDKNLHFPPNLMEMRWGEAELLVRSLAHLLRFERY